MKCTVCREPAQFKVARHNSAFCTEHFHQHILRQVTRVIKKFKMFEPQDKILLGVSGGKDSMGLWKVLSELGYKVTALHINNGFGDFSNKSQAVVRKFAAQNNLPLKVYSFEDLMGFSFDEACKVSGRPVCSLCGTMKRYIMNKLAEELECNVIATGHNLDDENAFLLGNVLHWQLGYLQRQHPVLEAEKGLVKKVKPLARITDREMELYVKSLGIEVVEDKCPHAEGATSHYYKKIMNELEKEFPNAKSDFYFGFIKKLKPHLCFESEKEEAKINYCIECGYKTIRKDRCFVCSLKERIENARRS